MSALHIRNKTIVSAGINEDVFGNVSLEVSTRHYKQQLNHLGVTIVSDTRGGGQNYQDDYGVVNHLPEYNQLTLRIAYMLNLVWSTGDFENFLQPWPDLKPIS